MRLLLFICLVIKLSLSTLQSQVVDWKAMARRDIDTLCAQPLGGRGYIDNGHRLAADFIAKRFSQIGLQAPKSRVESELDTFLFSFPLRIHLIEGGALQMGNTPMELGTDFILSRLSSAAPETIAPIVDIGYGLEPDSSDVKAKIVMLREGFPDYVKENDSLLELYRPKRQIWDRLEPYIYQQPAGFILLQQKLTAGFSLQAIGLPVIEAQIDSIPAQADSARFQITASPQVLESYNVAGYLEGSQSPDTFIVVSAHYDHLGKMGSALFPGANDNASGVAMMLTIATQLAKTQQALRYSVLFIAFGGEEVGLQGSRHYVEQAPIVPLEQTKFVLNLDLMGNGDKGIVAVGGKDYPGYLEMLRAFNEDSQYVSQVGARPNAPNSDHYFFLTKDIPGFFIYTLGGPPHYHDVNDNPSNLPLSRFDEVRSLLIDFLHSF